MKRMVMALLMTAVVSIGTSTASACHHHRHGCCQSSGCGSSCGGCATSCGGCAATAPSCASCTAAAGGYAYPVANVVHWLPTPPREIPTDPSLKAASSVATTAVPVAK